jgi:hypothetical protein
MRHDLAIRQLVKTQNSGDAMALLGIDRVLRLGQR